MSSRAKLYLQKWRWYERNSLPWRRARIHLHMLRAGAFIRFPVQGNVLEALDDGNLAGLRYEQWKAVFLEQKAEGFDVWQQPMVQLRLPMLFNLRSDPFERAQHESGDYVRWFIEHAFVVGPAQGIVAQHLASFVHFPPRQKPGSFSVEQAMEKLRAPPANN